jgi:hypothetical protein
MPGLLTENWKCKQIASVTERRGLSRLKQAYDLHAVHTTFLRGGGGRNVYESHSNNIHEL